ncbi:MAG: hypothetical protein Q4G51_15530 [Dermatophilus congolensis]|nr:hypothetical protein [Dermatophilus congolensis]
MNTFAYDGRAYVSPLQRGVTLIDLPEYPDLTDFLPTGDTYLTIQITALTEDEYHEEGR